MKKLSKKARGILIACVSVVLVAAIVVGIVLSTQSSSAAVNVYEFDNIGMTEYWGDSQESYGPISTDHIQTVYLSDTQTVTEILVSEGDTVKEGDLLMTFDTTLSDLELERKRLEVEKAKLTLQDDETELKRINSMKPMQIVTVVDDSEDDEDLGTALSGSYHLYPMSDYDGSSEDTAFICWVADGYTMGSGLFEAILSAAQAQQAENAAADTPETEATEETTESTEETTEPEETTEATEETTEATEETTEATEETTEATEETTEATEETTEATEETTEATEETTEATEETTEATEETTEATEETTEETEESTEAPTGDSSSASAVSEDTTVSVNDCYVIIKITSGNMSMGSSLVWLGMHISRSGGSYSFSFFTPTGTDYTLNGYEPDDTDTPDIDYGSGYTAAQISQLRTEQQKKIVEDEQALKMAEAEYKIMQTEISDGNIYAEFDGTVISCLTEDEAKEQNLPVLKVSGGGGFTITGTVSELVKDTVEIGQSVTVYDWNNGMSYEGTVTSVGDFPSSSGYYSGSGNNNVSYYPLTVFVDESADLREGYYASITYSAGTAENGVYLENMFIRTENGKSYVMVRGDDGKLEKRYVTTGKSLYGYYTQILSGVTEDDYFAFPYGKSVKEGAQTVEAEISELYNS